MAYSLPTRHAVGKLGETIAARHIEKQGYRILERNDQTKYGEIDIIAQHGRELVFVEVRTRTEEFFGSPEDTITRKKKIRLLKNASAYAARHRWTGPFRIEIVCVVLNKIGDILRITHYKEISF